MTVEARPLRRRMAAALESLETRALLSDSGLGLSVANRPVSLSYESADIHVIESSPAYSVSGSVAVDAVGQMPAVTVRVESPAVSWNAMSGQSGGSQLVIEIGPQPARGPLGPMHGYMEDGWLVLEMPMPVPEPRPPVIGEGTGATAGLSPSRPNTSRVPEQQIDLVLNDGRLSAIDSAARQQPLPAAANSFDHWIEGGDQDSASSQDESAAVDGESDRSLSIGSQAPVGNPTGGSVRPAEGAGLAVAPHALTEQALETLDQLRAGPAVTAAGSSNDGQVLESIKGIKIRGTYEDPQEAGGVKKVVDLAVVQFEQPVTVRLQVPFMVGGEEDVSHAGAEVIPLDVQAVASAVDAVLPDIAVEGAGLGVREWQVGAGVAIVAAAVGYYVGRQRGPAAETPISAGCTEPFTPVFSELQLSRLTGRLGAAQSRGIALNGFKLVSRHSALKSA